MTNAILDKNGGLDSHRALSTAHNILLNHDLQRPILYHVVITGGDIETYQAVIKKLIRRIRTKCRVEYFGAYEVAENRDGAHAHIFILIETRHNQPFKFLDIRKGGYLLKLAKAHKLVKPDGAISPIHVSPPKNAMHRGQMFAVPEGEELLADCLKWCTYEYKKRSKEGVERREVYFNSEFESNKAKRVEEKAKRVTKKKPAPDSPIAALPAAKETIAAETDSKPLQGDSKPSEWVGIKLKPEPHQEAIHASGTHYNDKGSYEERIETQYRTISQGEACNSSTNSTALGIPRSSGYAPTEACSSPIEASSTRYSDGSGASTPDREEGIEVKLTPAETYVATQYEAAVDQQLNVDALRLFLLEQGIRKTPAQVAWELEEKYGFLGYASRHPAPQRPDTRMLDALIDRTPLRANRARSQLTLG